MRVPIAESVPVKEGRTFLKKGADAFLVIVAVINAAAEGLEALKGFGVERMGVGEGTHFFFHHAEDER